MASGGSWATPQQSPIDMVALAALVRQTVAEEFANRDCSMQLAQQPQPRRQQKQVAYVDYGSNDESYDTEPQPKPQRKKKPAFKPRDQSESREPQRPRDDRPPSSYEQQRQPRSQSRSKTPTRGPRGQSGNRSGYESEGGSRPRRSRDDPRSKLTPRQTAAFREFYSQNRIYEQEYYDLDSTQAKALHAMWKESLATAAKRTEAENVTKIRQLIKDGKTNFKKELYIDPEGNFYPDCWKIIEENMVQRNLLPVVSQHTVTQLRQVTRDINTQATDSGVLKKSIKFLSTHIAANYAVHYSLGLQARRADPNFKFGSVANITFEVPLDTIVNISHFTKIPLKREKYVKERDILSMLSEADLDLFPGTGGIPNTDIRDIVKSEDPMSVFKIAADSLTYNRGDQIRNTYAKLDALLRNPDFVKAIDTLSTEQVVAKLTTA